MHLITPLASGINGAESGSARILKRDTATGATWYSDFEGTSADSGDVTLDSNGGAAVYVNELVTVKVYNAFGALVRTFTTGVDAPAVEVKSQSFTGRNYVTAATAAGEPTTLKAALDLWKTSSGTTDFNVLVNGTATKLSTFAASLTDRVYNVTDDAYGAVGDGTTDDSSAIQAALDAANTAGGGTVYFPPGTYFIGTGLTVNGNTGLRGSSRTTAALLIDSSGVTNGVTLAASSVVTVSDLEIAPDGEAGAGASILTANGTSLSAFRCAFGAAAAVGATETTVDIQAGDATFTDCLMRANLAATVLNSYGLNIGGTATSVVCTGCAFETYGQYGVGYVGYSVNAEDIGTVGYFVGCTFRASSITTGTHTYLNATGATNVATLLAAGCRFFDNTVVTRPAAGSTTGAASAVRMVGCHLGSSLSAGSGDSNIGAAGNRGYNSATDNSANLTVYPGLYEAQHVVRSNGTAQTVNFDTTTTPPRGSMFTLVFQSTGGAVPVITFGTGVTDVSGQTLAANKYTVTRFVYANATWIELGTAASTA